MTSSDQTRQLLQLRHDMRTAPWIDDLTVHVSQCDRSDWGMGTIEVVERTGTQLLAASGRIAEHVDEEFPPWSYLLVLECPAKSTLHVRGHEPLDLRPGMLVEFNAHVRHRLVQGRRDHSIWCPIDSETQIPLDEAFSRFSKLFG